MILNNIDNDSCVVDSMFEVVHEVKNSIAVCKGYLEIIDSGKNNDLNKYISVIKNEINRSIGIINEFMVDKKISLKREVMDINLLLKDLCNDIRLFVENNSILFEFDVRDDESYIWGDYDKLKQVFLNFIKNSIESIDDDNGRIILTSFTMDDYFCVVIRDNGCGMNEELLNKIKGGNFTTKENGNGIGVRFSNKIIEGHSGSLVYNSLVGCGTEVIVKLPLIML